ncbi:MAG: NADP-dependent phosphogluconate dehydrogenase [Gammaproteobacteria bacterium]|nr:NADP-dependent phosphogluconate dehydrogenase [Gammaproteobacteria bacterium]
MKSHDIGIIGLGVMGQNLALNMTDKEFSVAGLDIDKNKVKTLQEANNKNIFATTNISDFIQSLKIPRIVLLLVPAGNPVDNIIDELIPFLQNNDLIIDAGNSHFIDTDRRMQYLQQKNLQFLGVGISGGESGARNGPSIMPGGTKKAYDYVKNIFEAIAAKVDNSSCVTFLGNGSAGHYVKMVHNGIEYGIMQLIAETYDLMKRGLRLNNNHISHIYQEWANSELNSYLLEITAKIFKKKDEKTNDELIDEIMPIAEQNGTGMWTSESSLLLQTPVPTIDAGVILRDLSVYSDERSQISKLYPRVIPSLSIDNEIFLIQLRNAYYASVIITYSQGMKLLQTASQKYHYQLNLESIATIWKGGCIIRASLLEDIRKAYQSQQQLQHLLLDENISKKILSTQEYLRQMVSHASHLGIPVPAMMASLSYFDIMKTTWIPANLIQAQRDYFGAHTYERIDTKGKFHTQWEEVN